MGLVRKTVRRWTTRLHEPVQIVPRGPGLAEFAALLDAQWERFPYPHWQRTRVDKGTQLLLQFAYQDMVRQGKPLPKLGDVGFRAFSQFDEDGILLYLFSLLGVVHKTSVEVCAGVGHECNTANLIINHAWDGLLVDGNAENVRLAREFYARYPDTFWRGPAIVQAWVEAATINELISGNGFSGEIDLLSLDMDGVDFWIWKAITCVNPRVVVLEFNDCIPADVSVAVPYDRSFTVSGDKPGYLGASLAAWVKLGREKGYRLVGINRNVLNAFFVRNDLGSELLPEVSAASCLSDPTTRGKSARWAQSMSAWEWVTI
jgi:hypothetical protein